MEDSMPNPENSPSTSKEKQLASPEVENTTPESKFSHLYKTTNKALQANPEQKREAFLIEHKEKLSERFNEKRDLKELFTEKEFPCESEINPIIDLMELAADDVINEPMEDSEALQNELLLRAEILEAEEKARKKYRRKMERRMPFIPNMNEWMVNVPEDLAEKWLVKFCPDGNRRLLITDIADLAFIESGFWGEFEGITKCYDCRGHYLCNFVTRLPGGGGKNLPLEEPGLTVLDCIYDYDKDMFYILDVIVWNHLSFIESEAEYRHQFLKSKFEEEPDFFKDPNSEMFYFKLIEHFPADKETMQRELYEYKSKNDVSCHGAVFYHREAPYLTLGTDLCTWLRVFMLPEKLNIRIPPEYEAMKPEGYVDSATFIKKCAEHRKKQRKWHKRYGRKRISHAKSELNEAEEELQNPEEELHYPEEESNYPEEESNYPEEESNYPEEESNYPEEESNYPEEEMCYPEEEKQPTEEEMQCAEQGKKKKKRRSRKKKRDPQQETHSADKEMQCTEEEEKQRTEEKMQCVEEEAKTSTEQMECNEEKSKEVKIRKRRPRKERRAIREEKQRLEEEKKRLEGESLCSESAQEVEKTTEEKESQSDEQMQEETIEKEPPIC